MTPLAYAGTDMKNVLYLIWFIVNVNTDNSFKERYTVETLN